MARIGLLSDSHGRATTTERAVRRLLDLGAQRLIHLGDIGSHEVIDALVQPDPAGGQLPCHIVFGNVDWDDQSLTRYAQSLSITVDHPVGRMTLDDGQRLIFLHGHDDAAFAAALDESPDWLCHGHSHRVVDRRVGSVRVVNPGALFRAPRYTVALLDTGQRSVEFIGVDAS